MRDLYLARGRRPRLAPGRDRRPARSTSTASGAGCRSTTAVSEAVGETSPSTPTSRPCAGIAAQHDVEVDPAWDKDKVFLELLGELVEPGLLQPTFLCDYPAIAQPLARPHRSEPGLIEAWDLIIAGVERGTGFSELVDPVVQREVLTAQSLRAAGGDPEAMQLDEDFLRALEYGAPPMGGLGLGHRPAGHAVHRREHSRDDPLPPPEAGGLTDE